MHIKTLWRNINVSKATTKESVYSRKSNTTRQKRSGGSRTSQSGYFSQSWFVATHRDRSHNASNRLPRRGLRYLGPVMQRRCVGSDTGRVTSDEKAVQSHTTKK